MLDGSIMHGAHRHGFKGRSQGLTTLTLERDVVWFLVLVTVGSPHTLILLSTGFEKGGIW